LFKPSHLFDEDTGDKVLRVKVSHDMYPIETWKLGSALSATSKQKQLTVMDAHLHMGHIAPGAVRRIIQDRMIVGVEVDLETPDEECESCIKGKTRRADIPKSHDTPQSKAPWEHIWTDVWGPPNITARGSYHYYISFTDDFTRYSKIYLMHHKSEALKHYQTFATWV
jgi:hypothetical protein